MIMISSTRHRKAARDMSCIEQENINMQTGTKVFQTEGKFTNYGVVEMIDGERKDGKFYYIRWHRSFASWCSESSLKREEK